MDEKEDKILKLTLDPVHFKHRAIDWSTKGLTANELTEELRNRMLEQMERMCESFRLNLVDSLFKRYPRPKIRWAGGRVMVYEISKKNKHYKFKKGERK